MLITNHLYEPPGVTSRDYFCKEVMVSEMSPEYICCCCGDYILPMDIITRKVRQSDSKTIFILHGRQ